MGALSMSGDWHTEEKACYRCGSMFYPLYHADRLCGDCEIDLHMEMAEL
ncbi:hypothetical protein HYV81_03030 [Candidatus Woesearchaeota archaeon]|nr:hypothetical protein [Candidatus Woesearchaeota archaeon]